MKLRRNTNLLIEPPAVATGDIAFNLIVFFLVCASTQPDSGRKQSIPKSESKTEKEQQSENIEVALTRNTTSCSSTATRSRCPSCRRGWRSCCEQEAGRRQDGGRQEQQGHALSSLDRGHRARSRTPAA